ncbi:hypothetical protein [Puia dinghuensis]|uniref:Uncharacterized protein n=1 Tax=Puia dinghuensis TaxID=1792502 RepID=A0A8J2XP64_9BACT|nr:hypothetical protein [Puia dinghuensis]GGA86777.1 hypothetical protein GCM10011511_07300 [Puia dinghuensis]
MITEREAGERDFSIRYLRHGFPEAFKVLFFEYYPELFSFSQMLLQHRLLARKMTIEAFFLLWSKRKEVDSVKKVKALLYLAVRNKCMEQLKAPAASVEQTVMVDAIPSSLPPELLRELFTFAARTL